MLSSSNWLNPSLRLRLRLRLVPLLLSYLLLLPLLTSAALFSKNSKVIQLNSSNFKSQVLNIQKPTFVAFTAPWCGHCQKLVPEYEKAAKSLDGIVKFTNLDCDEEQNKPLCGKYGVKGFPTLKMFPPTKKRMPKDYQGARDGKSMSDYAVDQLPLGTKKLKAEELLDWVTKNSDSPRVILFSTKHSSTPMYKSLALDYRSSMKFAFLKADVAAVRSSARIHLGLDIKDDSDLPQLIVIPSSKDGFEFSKGDFLKYDGKLGYYGIRDWLKEISDQVGAVESDESDSTNAKLKAKSSPKSNSNSKSSKVKVDSNEKPKKSQGVKLGKMSKKNDGDGDEDGNPQRGAYEWKAQKKEDEAKEKEERRKRISDAHEKTKKKLEEARKKEKGEENDPKKLVFGENEAQASRSSKSSSKQTPESEYVEREDSDSNPIVSAAASVASSMASAGQEAYTVLADAGKEAYEFVSTEAKDLLDDIAEELSGVQEKIKEAVGIKDQESDSYSDSDSDSDSTYSQKSTSSSSTSSDEEEEASSSSSNFAPDWDRTKSKLLNTFKSFMSSENVDVDEEYSSDLKEAQMDALKIFRQSPEKAIQMAKDAEEWLMTNFQVDRDSMADLLGNLQLDNLDGMLEVVKDRFQSKVKKGIKGYNQILKEEEEEWQRKEEEEDERERERLRKKSHDEL